MLGGFMALRPSSTEHVPPALSTGLAWPGPSPYPHLCLSVSSPPSSLISLSRSHLGSCSPSPSLLGILLLRNQLLASPPTPQHSSRPPPNAVPWPLCPGRAGGAWAGARSLDESTFHLLKLGRSPCGRLGTVDPPGGASLKVLLLEGGGPQSWTLAGPPR